MITIDSKVLKDEADTMYTLNKYSREYVVKPYNNFRVSDSNFLDRGLTLCGVLKINENLEDFKKKWINQKLKQSLMS